MNNLFGRTLAIVGAGLFLASLGAAQGYRRDRGHDDGYYGGGYSNGGRRANPPKALDHQFLDLFRGGGHLQQDRRNYERQQRRYNDYGYGGYDRRDDHGYTRGRGYDDHGRRRH